MASGVVGGWARGAMTATQAAMMAKSIGRDEGGLGSDQGDPLGRAGKAAAGSRHRRQAAAAAVASGGGSAGPSGAAATSSSGGGAASSRGTAAGAGAAAGPAAPVAVEVAAASTAAKTAHGGAAASRPASSVDRVAHCRRRRRPARGLASNRPRRDGGLRSSAAPRAPRRVVITASRLAVAAMTMGWGRVVNDARSTAETKHATYSYGDSSRPGVLLGFPLRQVLPVGVGVLVATVGLMAGLFVLVVVGPVVGCVLAFGRWRGAPLYEFAWPGLGLLWHRGRARGRRCRCWRRGRVEPSDIQASCRACRWWRRRGRGRRRPVAVVQDRPCGTVSATITASADGFAMRSLREQDVMAAMYGATLAPFARPQSPVCQIIWQEWSYPKGVAVAPRAGGVTPGARRGPHPHPPALDDYEALLGAAGAGDGGARGHVHGDGRSAPGASPPADGLPRRCDGGVGRGDGAVHPTSRRRRHGAVGAPVARRADRV